MTEQTLCDSAESDPIQAINPLTPETCPEATPEESTPLEQPPEAVPEPETVFVGSCPSLTGRSTLSFSVGRLSQDGSLHLRLVANDGGGMFYDGWAEASRINALVQGSTGLTAKRFHALHPGRSVNTAGFVLACLKHLGLIRTNASNTRLHEHVPGTTFEQVALAAMGQITARHDGSALSDSPPSGSTSEGSEPGRSRKTSKPRKEGA